MDTYTYPFRLSFHVVRFLKCWAFCLRVVLARPKIKISAMIETTCWKQIHPKACVTQQEVKSTIWSKHEGHKTIPGPTFAGIWLRLILRE
jgi:hypothetical protein